MWESSLDHLLVMWASSLDHITFRRPKYIITTSLFLSSYIFTSKGKVINYICNESQSLVNVKFHGLARFKCTDPMFCSSCLTVLLLLLKEAFWRDRYTSRASSHWGWSNAWACFSVTVCSSGYRSGGRLCC